MFPEVPFKAVLGFGCQFMELNPKSDLRLNTPYRPPKWDHLVVQMKF
jgi:hypothetical protein